MFILADFRSFSITLYEWNTRTLISYTFPHYIFTIYASVQVWAQFTRLTLLNTHTLSDNSAIGLLHKKQPTRGRPIHTDWASLRGLIHNSEHVVKGKNNEWKVEKKGERPRIGRVWIRSWVGDELGLASGFNFIVYCEWQITAFLFLVCHVDLLTFLENGVFGLDCNPMAGCM